MSHQRALSLIMPYHSRHCWPNDLWYSTDQPESHVIGVILETLTTKIWIVQGNTASLVDAYSSSWYIWHMQHMSEEIWAHLSSHLSRRPCMEQDCVSDETNKRLSEKSSHCATVNCQLWYGAGTLILPADKVALVRSAEPSRLCTRLDEGKERLWLQQHPLGEALLAALSPKQRAPLTARTVTGETVLALLCVTNSICVHQSDVQTWANHYEVHQVCTF